MNNWSILLTILLGGVKHGYGSTIYPEFKGLWGDWGKWEYCKEYGHAVSYKIRVQSNQGSWYDDSAMNDICLICSGGDVICSKKGYWGKEYTSETTCSGGFNEFKILFEGKQDSGDDTAANSIELRCKDSGKWAKTEAYKSKTSWGGWSGGKPNCPDGQVICGLQTRVEKDHGNWGDDTALNGVKFDCCTAGLNPQTAVPNQGSTCSGQYPGRACCTKNIYLYRNHDFVPKPCVFPFSYKGKMYTSCTSRGMDRPWCGTKNNEDNTKYLEWGYCACYADKPQGTKTCGGPECEDFEAKRIKRMQANNGGKSVIGGGYIGALG